MPNIKRPIEDKFWEKVIVLEKDKCWEWVGGKCSNGYGTIGYKGRSGFLSHRLSYILNIGEIPDGLLVLHECDNPSCVNPNHLFLGTHKENSEDMVHKGRQACGIRSGAQKRCKLSLEDVEKIRLESGSSGKIAKTYGVHPSTITRIKSGKRWGWLNVT